MGAEDATLDPGAESNEGGAERVVEGLRDGAGCGGLPGGAPALAGVAVQGELRDDQDRCADVGGRLLVGEDPQTPDLPGHPLDLGGGVGVGDTEVDQQAGRRQSSDDSAVYDHGRRGNTLYDGTHALIIAGRSDIAGRAESRPL